MQLRLGRPEEPEVLNDRRKRRVGSSTAVSLVVHVVVLFAIWKAIQVPVTFERWLHPDRTELVRAENLYYIPIAPTTPPAAAPAQPENPSAAPSRSRPATPAAPPLVAPREVPSGVPAPPAAPVTPAPAPGTPGARGGDVTNPARGIQPNMVDPRLWPDNPPFVYAPKTAEERLDSALIASIKRKQDSIAANTYSPNKFERGDWTIEKGGQKYGIDPDFIRLGKFSIPTALLALLPFNKGGAPVDPQRDRSVSAMRADIQYHAQAAMNEAEFRAAVRAIRDRKDRERKALAHQQSIKRRTVAPGATASPGDRPPQ
jgi:hypothetical protein